jgi:GntR family transcriptional repressor for pyruvate dehydrogenase complex
MVMISNGEYKGGDRFPTEAELSERFSMSRVTIREAIQRLNMLGILTSKQGDGTYVSQIAPSTVIRPIINNIVLGEMDVLEIYDARLFIEIGNARLAARKCNASDRDKLKDILNNMDQVLEQFTAENFNNLDTQFHREIGRISGNQILLSAYSALKDIIRINTLASNISEATARESVVHHREIADMVIEHNEYMAGIAMERHIVFSKSSLIRVKNLNAPR